MSFQYGQYGTGLKRTPPAREAQQFRDLVKTRGSDVKIIALAETSEDVYGNPVYSESSYTEKAFVERSGRELGTMAGTLKLGALRIFVVPWAAVKEEGCEVEVEGARYRVTGLAKTTACIEVEAERKVE